MAAGVQHIENHWESTVAPSVLEQYREHTLTDGQAEELGCENRWQAMLKAVVDQMQIGEDATDELSRILDFNGVHPTGGQLDWLAGLVNVKRYPGETDAHFFERFVNDLGRHNAGTPDGVIYSAAILSGDPRPQYIDEADCTFFVYTGRRPIIGTDEWERGGRQLSRSQVRKMAPAGVLGLPAAAIRLDGGKLLGTYADNDNERKLIVVPASDRTISREVLLADNNGAIVVTPQSVPVRVLLRGPSVPSIPTITTEWNGVPVDAVRIKDLPDAGDTNGYFVRDSETEGTTSTRAMDEQTLDDLWNSTPAEDD